MGLILRGLLGFQTTAPSVHCERLVVRVRVDTPHLRLGKNSGTYHRL